MQPVDQAIENNGGTWSKGPLAFIVSVSLIYDAGATMFIVQGGYLFKASCPSLMDFQYLSASFCRVVILGYQLWPLIHVIEGG
jgi:hypothetical protein